MCQNHSYKNRLGPACWTGKPVNRPPRTGINRYDSASSGWKSITQPVWLNRIGSWKRRSGMVEPRTQKAKRLGCRSSSSIAPQPHRHVASPMAFAPPHRSPSHCPLLVIASYCFALLYSTHKERKKERKGGRWLLLLLSIRQRKNERKKGGRWVGYCCCDRRVL